MLVDWRTLLSRQASSLIYFDPPWLDLWVEKHVLRRATKLYVVRSDRCLLHFLARGHFRAKWSSCIQKKQNICLAANLARLQVRQNYQTMWRAQCNEC